MKGRKESQKKTDDWIWTQVGKYSQFFQKIVNPTTSENATCHDFCESLFLALPVDSTTAGLRETPTLILHKTTVTHLTPPLPEGQKKIVGGLFFFFLQDWGALSPIVCVVIFTRNTAALQYLMYFILFFWDSFEFWCLSWRHNYSLHRSTVLIVKTKQI